MEKKVGFGIVGGGAISKWHALAIKDIADAELIGVFDANPDNAKAFAGEFSCETFAAYEDMLACDKIDAVCICTPSGLHAPLAIKAANAKKNVVVEKPMAITKEQLDGFVEAVRQNNVKGAVISQMRVSDSVQKVKKAIENGELGEIIMANVDMKYYRSKEYYEASGWRGTFEMDGGGALMNQGIHAIDLLIYLGGDVKAVSGKCKTLVHNIEVEDTACLSIEFANGALGTIVGTTSVTPGYPRTIEICGTRGTIALLEDAIVRWDVEGASVDLSEEKSSNGKSFKDPMAFDYKNHRIQLTDFVNAIKENREPVINVDEGRKSVELILAAYEASKTDKKIYI